MNWIKIEHSLPDKMEVLAIARHTGLSVDEVVGKLVRLWCWEDQHGRECFVKSAKSFDLERLGVTQDFAEAMEKVGWLRVLKTGIRFPDIDRHNSQLAKRKALNAQRQARHRAKTCNESVTPSRDTPVTPACTEGVTRREETRLDKRRGDESGGYAAPVVVVAALKAAGITNPEPVTACRHDLSIEEVQVRAAMGKGKGSGWLVKSIVEQWEPEKVKREVSRLKAAARGKVKLAEFEQLGVEFDRLDDAEVARCWGLLDMAVKRVPPRANIRAARDTLPKLMRLAKARRKGTP